MKTMFNIFILCFLATACSSSYVVSSSNGDKSVDEFNESAEGEEAEIILRDSLGTTTTDVYLSVRSLYWIDPDRTKNHYRKI